MSVAQENEFEHKLYPYLLVKSDYPLCNIMGVTTSTAIDGD